MSPNEMVVLVTFTARIGDVEGLLNLCIPHMAVEPVMSKLSTRLWFSLIEHGSTDESRKAIEHKIEESKIPISAILGRTTISVHDFLMLQQGDVLSLNTDVDGKIEVIVGDMLKFYGKPGARNKKLAIKVTDVIREEEY
jgi:flagellar motor switch protein FliM